MRMRVRRVPTASGATAVQAVASDGHDTRIIEHLGSAHSNDELMFLEAIGDQIVHQGEDSLFDAGTGKGDVLVPMSVACTYSGLLWDQLSAWWCRLGFDVNPPGVSGEFPRRGRPRVVVSLGG